MTLPPLPASPVIRCQLVYNEGSGLEAGSRFFLGYSSGTPTAPDLASLATSIATFWNGQIAALTNTGIELVGVNCQDITTLLGLEGSAVVAHPGTRSGTPLPRQVAMNTQFLIARHYRGGKPKMYFPCGVEGDLLDQSTWDPTFITTAHGNVAAFFAACAAVTETSFTTNAHVNVSFYFGFQNFTPPGKRYYARPLYRNEPPNPTTNLALVDPITGYIVRPELSSQRRRRESTTP